MVNEKLFEYTEATKPQKLKKIDFNQLYDHSHSELSLQQTKRDQIISLYVGLVTFAVPFSFSLSAITILMKSFIFMVLGIIGIVLSVIVIRYRIYKEVYWLCCETISNFCNNEYPKIDKKTVQSLFYQTMVKRSGSVVKHFNNGNKHGMLKLMKAQLFSAETLYLVIIDFLSSIILGLGLSMAIGKFGFLFKYVLPVIVAIVVFLILYINYCKNVKRVYNVVLDGLDSSFNFSFSKAWFLHIYSEEKADEENEKIEENKTAEE